MDLSPLDDSDPGDRFERFVSGLGIEARSPGTFSFRPGGDLGEAWRLWQEHSFLPILLPAYLDAHDCGIRNRTRELHEVDRALDGRLPAPARDRSVAAARPFFSGKSEMRGNREWRRFAEGVEDGASPGHLTVVHAIQSALYHVALVPALESYAWFEFRSRRIDFPADNAGGDSGFVPDANEEETAVFSTILPHLRVALSDDSGHHSDSGNDDETPRFRVV